MKIENEQEIQPKICRRHHNSNPPLNVYFYSFFSPAHENSIATNFPVHINVYRSEQSLEIPNECNYFTTKPCISKHEYFLLFFGDSFTMKIKCAINERMNCIFYCQNMEMAKCEWRVLLPFLHLLYTLRFDIIFSCFISMHTICLKYSIIKENRRKWQTK